MTRRSLNFTGHEERWPIDFRAAQLGVPVNDDPARQWLREEDAADELEPISLLADLPAILLWLTIAAPGMTLVAIGLVRLFGLDA